MQIKTNYYYRSKEGSTKYGGVILFNRYRILKAQGHNLPDKGVVFYSTSTDDILKVDDGRGELKSINVNRILTEKDYTTTQMEYYIYLNWLNKQKFKWMYGRHLLQQFSIIHLVLITALVYFAYQILINLND